VAGEITHTHTHPPLPTHTTTATTTNTHLFFLSTLNIFFIHSLRAQAYRAHQGQVECLSLVGHRIFSGGDKRVYCSAYESGEFLHQVTRDSGEIPYMVVNKGDLYVGSVNGSIRTFPITHNVKNMKVRDEGDKNLQLHYHSSPSPMC